MIHRLARSKEESESECGIRFAIQRFKPTLSYIQGGMEISKSVVSCEELKLLLGASQLGGRDTKDTSGFRNRRLWSL